MRVVESALDVQSALLGFRILSPAAATRLNMAARVSLRRNADLRGGLQMKATFLGVGILASAGPMALNLAAPG